jgi:hypothetical protein
MKMTEHKFTSFEIEFNQQKYLKIKCIKLLQNNEKNSFKVYLGIDLTSDELFYIYEWRVLLEKNKIYDEKKLEICKLEVLILF